jgi:hypothetical protein
MRTIVLILMGGWLTACSGSVYESGGGTAAVGAAGAGSSGGSGASSGTVIATGGAISGKTEWIPGCTVAPGESWTKCQTGVAAPAAVPPAQMEVQDPSPGDFNNIPGVQEVHWVMTESACKALFNKLRREGESFNLYLFFPSRMPGARKQGHCKLIGPSSRDDRFVDRRYETDN